MPKPLDRALVEQVFTPLRQADFHEAGSGLSHHQLIASQAMLIPQHTPAVACNTIVPARSLERFFQYQQWGVPIFELHLAVLFKVMC